MTFIPCGYAACHLARTHEQTQLASTSVSVLNVTVFFRLLFLSAAETQTNLVASFQH